MFFSEKVAIVTGGASGIGFAFVKELLKQGAKGVGIADINDDVGSKAAKELGKEFGANRVFFRKTDVSDKSQFEAVFKLTIETFGSIDILINNAGMCNEKQWERLIAINLQGTINGILLGFDNYIKNFKKGSEGIIINLSSVTALAPAEAFPIYGATKSGIIGLTRAYGSKNHYKRSSVKIMAVCPGATKTPIFNDIPENMLLGEDYIKLILKTETFQQPEEVAEALIPIVSTGKTGSVWVVEEGKYFEYFIPNVEGLKYKSV